MKAVLGKTPHISITAVDCDPLRLIGLQSVFDCEQDFELTSASLFDVGSLQNIDLVLLSDGPSRSLLKVIASLKASHPNLDIIVIGSAIDDETILKAMAFGAKGYIDAAASPADFVHAIRIVRQGSVWAPRRLLSLFIQRVSGSSGRNFSASRVSFTNREMEVLEMLVGGSSNKEIGARLGIEERTVKAHVSKLMRKSGVENRVALSIHAVTHALVSSERNESTKNIPI